MINGHHRPLASPPKENEAGFAAKSGYTALEAGGDKKEGGCNATVARWQAESPKPTQFLRKN
jgi:hypothetical protein